MDREYHTGAFAGRAELRWGHLDPPVGVEAGWREWVRVERVAELVGMNGSRERLARSLDRPCAGCGPQKGMSVGERHVGLRITLSPSGVPHANRVECAAHGSELVVGLDEGQPSPGPIFRDEVFVTTYRARWRCSYVLESPSVTELTRVLQGGSHCASGNVFPFFTFDCGRIVRSIRKESNGSSAARSPSRTR